MKSTLYQYLIKNISVVDGNTLKADVDLGFGVILAGKRIRLEHINCPEKNTDASVTAKQFTWNWITSKKSDIVVSVKNHREDKYGRILGSVVSDGQSLAEQLKLAGHGVDYVGGKR